MGKSPKPWTQWPAPEAPQVLTADGHRQDMQPASGEDLLILESDDQDTGPHLKGTRGSLWIMVRIISKKAG